MGPFQLSFKPLDNLNLKVISLALAVGLWNVVPDPTVPHIVQGVPIQLIRVPSEVALAEPFDTTLDVLVRGNTLRTRELLSGELSPRIDLFGRMEGEHTITIRKDDIPTPLGVSVDSIQPSQIRVVLEEKVRAVLPVNAVLEGSPAEGFAIADTVTEPAAVTVAGPRSRVEALDGATTEVVSVAGRRRPLSRTVTVVSGDPLVTVEGAATVQLTIQIEAVPVRTELEDLEVIVENARYRVDINPARIGVLLRGPPSVLEQLTPTNIRIVLDAGGLEPRAADYRVEPRVEFVPAELADRIEVLALIPQQRIDVHVYPQPIPADR